MKEIINKYIDTFKVTKVKIMNKIEFENNPMIIHLPEGAGYINDDYSKETFNKIRIEFEIFKEQEVFTVLVDDFLYIGSDGKLIDALISANELLQQSLIDAVSSLHPEHVFEISEKESKTCFNFLQEYF